MLVLPHVHVNIGVLIVEVLEERWEYTGFLSATLITQGFRKNLSCH